MATKIIMPKQGLQMSEGTITAWLVPQGGEVELGKPLFEIETDKLTITIDATASGTLLKILHDVGDVVPITETIAIVGESGEDYSSLLEEAGQGETAKEAAPEAAVERENAPAAPAAATEGSGFASPRAKWQAKKLCVDCGEIAGSGPDGMVVERDVFGFVQNMPKATPAARKIAQTEGVSLTEIAGSGPHGKICKEDVRAALGAVQTEKGAGGTRGETKVPLSGMRRVISSRMKGSLLEMAQANHHMRVDMSEAVRLREQLKKADVKVGYNDMILYCTARALTDFPMMNASMTEDGIVLKHYVNMGMAVSVDDGLLVPVIRDADLLPLRELSARAAELAKKARENRLAPGECSGGTFTVSNLGMFDVDRFTAIINPPEAGILAVGKLEKQPVAVDDQVVIRPMLTLSLTYDHRIIDGAPAAQFLRRVKQLLENPGLLL
jgi:pyruvate dehydrogenase E2 component (dihydrolipoamide acetyltransferase)